MNLAKPSSLPPPKAVLWFLGGVWALFSLNLGWSVALFQPNVLTSDQWDFFAPLFHDGTWWDLFKYQHGPHRQGVGYIFTSWVLAATHWDARADSLWIVALLSLSALLALRLKWKLTGSLSIWDAWIPLLGLTLAQFEAVLITPNASHSAFPLMLIFLAANLWLAANPFVRYLVAGVLAVALTFTGFGLFSGALLTLLLAAATARETFGRRWLPASIAGVGFAIAVMGWLIFRSDYRFIPAVEGFKFPWTPLSDYFRFIALMLAYPAGTLGESAAHYLFGGLLGIALLAATVLLGWKWIRTKQSSPILDVLLLLLGTGVLFVCNTAVGRIPLGVAAGMTSRYVTLMFPLWLGIYLFAVTARTKPLPAITTAVLWGMALWPYHEMTSRPLSAWPGTFGATQNQCIFFEQYTFEKTGWVDTYLKTKSWAAAQQAFGGIVYPDPAGTRMDEKLGFLQSRGLLFYAPGHSFLPYFAHARAVWNREFPTSNIGHSLNAQTRLTFVTKEMGVAEITVSSDRPLNGASLALDIRHDGQTRTISLPQLPARISLPVGVGLNVFEFRPVATSPSENLHLGPPQFETTRSPGSIVF